MKICVWLLLLPPSVTPIISGYPAMDGTNDGSPSSKLHTRLRLWEFPDCYILEPIDGLADLFLSVSRANGTMNLVEALPPCGSSTPKVQTVYGVIGVLKLAVGSFFLVITDRDCVGSYLGHAIFKVTGLKVLPCNNALNTTSAEQVCHRFLCTLLSCCYKYSLWTFKYTVGRKKWKVNSRNSWMLQRGLSAFTSPMISTLLSREYLVKHFQLHSWVPSLKHLAFECRKKVIKEYAWSQLI